MIIQKHIQLRYILVNLIETQLVASKLYMEINIFYTVVKYNFEVYII